MNTRIKLLIVGTIALFGFFTGGNMVSAQTVVAHCDTATMTGTVYPNGSRTEAWFDWGATTPPSFHTAHYTFYSTSSYNDTITGLTPSTRYYYRAMAQNAGGLATGQTKDFYTPACPVAAPTVTLSANPMTVPYNGTSTITWYPNNATSCNATGGSDGWTGPRSSTQSSFTTTGLKSNTTFYITCKGDGGTTPQQSITVNVDNPPSTPKPTVSLSAFPKNNIVYGGSTTLTWSSTNATSCYASSGSWSGNKTASTSQTTERINNLTYSQTFTLTCTGAGGDASASDYVTVGSQILTYTVTATAGNGGTINPSSTVVNSGGITSFTVSPNSGYLINSVSGSCGGNLSGNIYTTNPIYSNCTVYANFTQNQVTYTVTATAGNGGTINPSSTVVNSGGITSFTISANTGYSISSVTGSCGGNLSGNIYTTNPIYSNCTVYASFSSITFAPTVILSADNQNLTSGRNTTVRWSTTNNPTSCTASGGTNGWAGNNKSTSNGSFYTGTLYSTTTYYMTCSNSVGQSTDSIIITVSQQAQNPSVTLTAGSTNITSGNSTYITWTPYNATSCSASGGSNGWSDYKSINGGSFPTGALYNNTTYSITCYNSSSTIPAYASVTVYVNNNNYNIPPIINLTANPTYVTSGGSSYISWNPTNNPTYCTASNGSNYWSGTTRSTYSGSFPTGALYTTTVYTMTCGNSAGATTESVTVNVSNQNTYLQPSVSITADRTNISSGENTIVRWYPINATSCYASGGSNNWAGTKSIYSNSFNTGTLSYSTTYTISCSNYNSGSDTKSVTVIVGSQQNNNQPTVAIATDEESVPYNGTTFVRWYTANATSCHASGGSSGWVGTKSIGPGSFYTGSLTTNKTYTLTCTNNFGSASDSTTVSVRAQTINNPKPTPTSLVLITSSVDRNQPIVPTIDNTRPKPGDEINYTVNYQNIGTGAITNLTLRMDLPYEVNYMFSTPNNPNKSGNTLIFNLGTLKANGQGTVTVRVKVRDNIPAGTNLNFPATLSYTDPSGFPQSVNANVSAQVWNEPTPTTVIEDNNTIQLGALAFLGGANFFPNTLLGWLLIILFIVLLVLAIKKAYYNPETTTISKKTTTTHS